VTLRRYREAFVGYHYLIAAAVGSAYAVVVYASRFHGFGSLASGVRGNLYLSLSATTGVLLGFAIAAVAIFTSFGSGAGLDLLREQEEFPYVKTVLMGAIYALAAALGASTCLIVVDAEASGDRWIEAIGVGVIALAILQTAALLWLLNKLLTVVVPDRQRDVGAN
jgi:hypothetical protein